MGLFACRQLLGVMLPALDIFRERTIVGLAASVAKALAEAQATGEGKRAFLRRKAAEWTPRRPRLRLPGRLRRFSQQGERE